VSRPPGLTHDVHFYGAYLREAERIRDQGGRFGVSCSNMSSSASSRNGSRSATAADRTAMDDPIATRAKSNGGCRSRYRRTKRYIGTPRPRARRVYQVPRRRHVLMTSAVADGPVSGPVGHSGAPVATGHAGRCGAAGVARRGCLRTPGRSADGCRLDWRLLPSGKRRSMRWSRAASPWP
jgi:hypothetical protein